MNDDAATRDPHDPDDAVLRQVASRLGARAAARLDVEQAARGVIERLHAPDVVPLGVRVYRTAPRWLRIAAGLVVLAGAGVVGRALVRSDEPPAPFVSDELTDLGVEQLTELLTSLDATLSGVTVPADSTLEDLDAEQLESVLRSLEG